MKILSDVLGTVKQASIANAKQWDSSWKVGEWVLCMDTTTKGKWEYGRCEIMKLYVDGDGWQVADVRWETGEVTKKHYCMGFRRLG